MAFVVGFMGIIVLRTGILEEETFIRAYINLIMLQIKVDWRVWGKIAISKIG
jgi:hypothetical protein